MRNSLMLSISIYQLYAQRGRKLPVTRGQGVFGVRGNAEAHLTLVDPCGADLFLSTFVERVSPMGGGR
jgi:hypothetical protein